jgi:hypothetical protein
MQAGRDQVRDSTRRFTTNGCGSHGSRFVKASISWSPGFAWNPPARDMSRALDQLDIVSRSIADHGRGHGANQDDPSAEGGATTKLFQLLAGRTLRRDAISSMIFVAMFEVLADIGRGTMWSAP